MKPALGAVVIVPMDPVENNGADQAPAVITGVWSDVWSWPKPEGN